MASDDARLREEQAREAADRLLHAADRQAEEVAKQRLPLTPGDVSLLDVALGMERRDPRAMMLSKAAGAMADFGDAAAGVGVARALEAFWVGEGQTDGRYRPLARVELGSVLVTQARGLVRLGEADRAKALCMTHAGWHDHQRYLAILAAEALARAERFDEARAIFPAERPTSNVAERTSWEIVHRLLEPYEPDDDPPAAGAAALRERWGQAVDAVSQLIATMGKTADVPEMITTLMLSRLDEERAKVPQSEQEFVRRVEGLRSALEGARPR